MAKLTDDQLRFIIDIEATGAQGQINTLSAEIGKLEKQNASLSSSLIKVNNELTKQEKKLAKMEAAGKTNTAAYKQLSAAVEANRKKQTQLSTELKRTQNQLDKDKEKVAQFTSSLKLNQMSMQQLRDRASQLRKQLDLTSKAASPETFKRLSSELSKTEAQMSKLGKKSSRVADIFKGTFGAGVALQGAMALFNAFREGVNTIVSFEAANASLAAVLGTTQDGIKELTEDANRLGKITEYSAAQVTQMQTELAKLGFSQNEIKDSTQYILQFATATGSDIPEAAQLAGAALRAFGMDTSETQRAVSAMAVATTKSALDFAYLQNSMSTIAPVAHAFGFTIEDTTALLGTLANSGFDASSAATATRNILLNLADGSGKLAQELGKPIQSLDELVPALQALQDKGVSLNEALELTDKRSVAAFETFLNGAGAITELRDSITGVGDDLAAMQETKLDTVEGSVKLLQSAWEGLMLQFYDSKGAFKSVVDFLVKIVQGLTAAVKWTQDNAKVLKITIGLLGTYGITLKTITALRAIDIKGILAQAKAMVTKAGVTKLATAANESLKRSLLTSPWGLIALAITAVIAGLVAFIKHTKEADAAQQAYNDQQERAKELAQEKTAEIQAEKQQLNSLVKAIIDTKDNEKLRADLIKTLNDQYPGLLGNLKEEEITNGLLAGVLANANEEYARRIELAQQEAQVQAYKESLVDLNKQLIQLEQDLASAEDADDAEEIRENIAKIQGAIQNMSEGYQTALTDMKEKESELARSKTAEGLKERMGELTSKWFEATAKAEKAVTLEMAQFYYAQAATFKNQMDALQLQYKAAVEKEAAEQKAKEDEEKKREADAAKQRQAAAKDRANKAKQAADKAKQQANKAYQDELKRLQDHYKKEQAALAKMEAQGLITHEEAAKKQQELKTKQAEGERAIAAKHHRLSGDAELKYQQAILQQRESEYKEEAQQLQKHLEDDLKKNAEALAKREITKEEYEKRAHDLSEKNLQDQLALAEKYGKDTSAIDKKISDFNIKTIEDNHKKAVEAAKKAHDLALKDVQDKEQRELALLDQKHNLGLISETQYAVQRQQLTETYAKARLGIEEIYAEAVKDEDASVVAAAQQAIEQAMADLDEATRDRLTKAREHTGELRDIFAETAEVLGDTLGGTLMSSLSTAMDAIIQFQQQSEAGFGSTGQKIAAHVQMIGAVASQVLQAASQITQQIFEEEASALEAAKQKELAAVGDNAEEKERIEQEYAQKELDLKKKQADADAAIQSASLWVNTAMGIATAWATSMQLGPIAGPIMAAILTTALLTTAGIQQANIIAQRDAIKNQTLESSGGSTAGINDSAASVSTTTIRDEYKPGGQGYSDGGYTGDGGVHEPAGIVHKGEYVVSQAELRNPSVVPMVRAIEGVRQSRKHGRAGVHGYADGGYTADDGSVNGILVETIQDLRTELHALRTEKIHADINYQEFKEVKQKMETLEKKGKL